MSVCTSGRKSGKLDNLQSLELVLGDYFKKKKNKNGGKLLAQAKYEINFQYTHLSRVYSAVCASIGI